MVREKEAKSRWREGVEGQSTSAEINVGIIMVNNSSKKLNKKRAKYEDIREINCYLVTAGM